MVVLIFYFISINKKEAVWHVPCNLSYSYVLRGLVLFCNNGYTGMVTKIVAD